MGTREFEEAVDKLIWEDVSDQIFNEYLENHSLLTPSKIRSRKIQRNGTYQASFNGGELVKVLPWRLSPPVRSSSKRPSALYGVGKPVGNRFIRISIFKIS